MLDYEATMEYNQMLNDHSLLVQAIKEKKSAEIPQILGQHLTAGLKRMNNKVLIEHAECFTQANDTEFWTNYNKKYES